MVGLVLLLQLAAASPGTLAAARTALDGADTATAVTVLRSILMQSGLSSEGLASFFLLDWIGRSPTQQLARRAWADALAHHRAWWTQSKRGALIVPVAEERRFDLMQINEGLRGGPRVMEHVTAALGHEPREVIAGMASPEEEGRDSLLAAATRWVMLREALLGLDSAAESFYAHGVRGPQRAALLAQDPPGQYRLLAHFAAEPYATTLGEITDLLAAQARAPWPFDALGARAHVVLCALLRVSAGVFGCWPDGRSIGGRDGTEVRTMAFGAQRRDGLAWRAMDEHPEWFAPLDERRAIVDAPRRVDQPAQRLPTALFWRIAWPLYLQPYNERQTVHRVRLLLADASRRLARDDRPGLFSPLGDPDLLVRVGVPLAIGGGNVFVSPATHETIVRGGVQGDWAPLDLYVAAGADDSRYVTGFTSEDYDVLLPFDHQLVTYQRDGRRWADIYTMWQAPATCESPRPVLGFFLLDEQQELQRRVVESDLLDHPRKRFHLTLPPGIYVYSLELLDRGCRQAQRARYMIRVPSRDESMLSDLALADELHYGDERRGADRLRDRQPVTMSPSLVVPAGGVARFYWEMYGITADSTEPGRLSVTFEVVNVRQGRVLIRDMRAAADAADRTAGTLDLTYAVTVPPGAAPLVSGLSVGIPEGSRGAYVARLRVTDTRTGQTATAQRAFFVRG